MIATPQRERDSKIHEVQYKILCTLAWHLLSLCPLIYVLIKHTVFFRHHVPYQTTLSLSPSLCHPILFQPNQLWGVFMAGVAVKHYKVNSGGAPTCQGSGLLSNRGAADLCARRDEGCYTTATSS